MFIVTRIFPQVSPLFVQRGMISAYSSIQTQTYAFTSPIFKGMQQRELSKAQCLEIIETVLHPPLLMGCFWAPEPYNLFSGFGAAIISCRYFYKHPEALRGMEKDIQQLFKRHDRNKFTCLLVQIAFQDPEWLAGTLKQLKVELQERDQRMKNLVESIETWEKPEEIPEEKTGEYYKKNIEP